MRFVQSSYRVEFVGRSHVVRATLEGSVDEILRPEHARPVAVLARWAPVI
jgi:hypothetical protein